MEMALDGDGDCCNDFIVITTADVKGVAADHRITCSPPVTKKINMHPVRHFWPYLASIPKSKHVAKKELNVK